MNSSMDDDLLELLSWDSNNLQELHRGPATPSARATQNSAHVPEESLESPTPARTAVGPTASSTLSMSTSSYPPLHLPESVAQRLFPHQREGVRWLYHRHHTSRAALLADEMGLGKTVQVCVLLAQLYAQKLIQTTVIVVPVTLLPMWVRMLNEWGGDALQAPGLVEVLHGTTKPKRAERWRRIGFGIPCLVLTSYGTLRQDSGSIPALQSSVVDYVVLDEAHTIKDHTSGAFKSVMQLSARHRVALTGTPVMNSFADMWSLFQFLDGAALTSFSSTKAAFTALSKTILRGNELDASAKEKQASKRELEKLQEMVRPFTLRREKSEVWEDITATVAKDPSKMGFSCSKQDVVLWVGLTGIQREQYESVLSLRRTNSSSSSSGVVAPVSASALLEAAEEAWMKDLTETSVQGDDTSSSQPDAPSTAAATTPARESLGLLSLLRDTCQHPWLLLHESAFQEAVQHLHTPPSPELGDVESGSKLVVAVELVSEMREEGHKVLVFSRYKKVLQLLGLMLTEAAVRFVRLDGETKAEQRVELVQRFNSSTEVGVCLLSTQVGGIGLTFDGASSVVLMDPSWNPALDNQAVDRVHRIGQTKDVKIFRLITTGTVEEKMYRNQIFKWTAAKQSMTHTSAVSVSVTPQEELRECSVNRKEEEVVEAVKEVGISQYFTRLQLRDMFAPGDYDKSETAAQQDLLQEQYYGLRAATSPPHSSRPNGSCATPWCSRGLPPAVRLALLRLPHVLDASTNLPEWLFPTSQKTTPSTAGHTPSGEALLAGLVEQHGVAGSRKRSRERTSNLLSPVKSVVEDLMVRAAAEERHQELIRINTDKVEGGILHAAVVEPARGEEDSKISECRRSCSIGTLRVLKDVNAPIE